VPSCGKQKYFIFWYHQNSKFRNYRKCFIIKVPLILIIYLGYMLGIHVYIFSLKHMYMQHILSKFNLSCMYEIQFNVKCIKLKLEHLDFLISMFIPTFMYVHRN
jgi:hypothetical protein